jgi:hypothetical protein
MINGLPLVDAHMHVARIPALKPAWRKRASGPGELGALVPGGNACQVRDLKLDEAQS